MNVAIIVAAGSGKRFGSAVPKQFLEISGKPLLIYTLERFEACPAIDAIVLILSAAEIGKFSNILNQYSFQKICKIVAGGTTRAESVRNGLNSLENTNVEIVAVHDGARPLVSIEEIARTFEKARETGAACLVAAVNDTIKEIADGKIVGTIDRNKLKRALTPQCFRYEILKRAFNENESIEMATDECFLVEKSGFEIAFVEGSGKNIKITTPEDFVLAETLLRQMNDQ